ncbi:MAG: caspase family protein [Acidobacteriota bacterium]|nr:caspase family protein [Acidobacteriota bacterium]
MRRALLIGSATYGLLGPEQDLELMTETLEAKGFQVTRLFGAEASRAGILAAMETLIAAGESDDAVLIHYSGHGGLVKNPLWRAGTDHSERQPRYLQFLVPTDIDASDNRDFRGLLDGELSLLLARLSEKTRNIALILDCCHAAGLGRPHMRVRSLKAPWTRGLPHHLMTLRANGGDRRRFAGGNPWVLRLSAAGANQFAGEYHSPRFGPVGLLTESLYLALRQAGEVPVSWLTLGGWVRERVLAMNAHQRPELEGPARRLLFQTRQQEAGGALSFFYFQDRPCLRAGRLHGVRKGNLYGLMDPHADAYRAESCRGLVEADQVHGGYTLVTVKAGTMPPSGLRAFPLSVALPRLNVILEGKPPAALLKAVTASSILETKLREDDMAGAVMVFTHEDYMQLIDETGQTAGPPTRNPNTVLSNLERLARAGILSRMPGGTGRFALPEDAFDLCWGTIQNDSLEALPETGSCLYIGDDIAVYFRNTGRVNLFVNLFNIGLDRTVTLLSHQVRSGVEVRPGDDLWLGFDPYTRVRDWRLGWPDELTRNEPRSESMVVIVSDQPQDLSMLESDGPTCRKVEQLPQLQRLTAQISRNPVRQGRDEGGDVRYAVRHLVFDVAP